MANGLHPRVHRIDGPQRRHLVLQQDVRPQIGGRSRNAGQVQQSRACMIAGANGGLIPAILHRLARTGIRACSIRPARARPIGRHGPCHGKGHGMRCMRDQRKHAVVVGHAHPGHMRAQLLPQRLQALDRIRPIPGQRAQHHLAAHEQVQVSRIRPASVTAGNGMAGHEITQAGRGLPRGTIAHRSNRPAPCRHHRPLHAGQVGQHCIRGQMGSHLGHQCAVDGNGCRQHHQVGTGQRVSHGIGPDIEELQFHGPRDVRLSPEAHQAHPGQPRPQRRRQRAAHQARPQDGHLPEHHWPRILVSASMKARFSSGSPTETRSHSGRP